MQMTPTKGAEPDLTERRITATAWRQLKIGVGVMAFNLLLISVGLSEGNDRLVAIFTGRSGDAREVFVYAGIGILLFAGSLIALSANLLRVGRRWSRALALLIHFLLLLAGLAMAGLGLVMLIWGIGLFLLVPGMLLFAFSLDALRWVSVWRAFATSELQRSRTVGFIVLNAVCLWFAYLSLGEGRPRALFTVSNQHGVAPSVLRFSDDGKTLVTSRGRGMQVVDTATGRVVFENYAAGETERRHVSSSTPRAEQTTVAMSPDGRWVAHGAEGQVDVWVWEASVQGAYRLSQTGRCECNTGALSFSPDKSSLEVGAEDGSVWRMDIGSGDMRELFRAYEAPPSAVDPPSLLDLQYAPDGRLVASRSSRARRSASAVFADDRTFRATARSRRLSRAL